MTAKLFSTSRNKILLPELETARSFWSRGVGLLGRKGLNAEQGLWILWGNSIHTCFMRFTIDCVFMDRNLKVKALKKNVKPWRFVAPVWGATSVIEMSEGMIEQLEIELGEQLNVVS